METVDTLITDAWRQLPSEEKFQHYRSVLGLPRQKAQNRITHQLSREFPSEWKEFQAVTKRRMDGDMSDDVYRIKNQSLRFSLLITILERGELHAKAFSSLESISDPISSILDVGCENGFLTCLFALRWPSARVIGIDLSTHAVHRARELASRLNLKNVTFVVGSAGDIPKHFRSESFDLITTVTMLHDAGLFATGAELNLRNSDVFKPIKISPLPPAFSAISSALGLSKARWVSMERCQSPATFSVWCQSLELAGLGIDWGESARLPCEDELLTMVVAGHDRARPIDLNKVHGFWMNLDFNRWSVPGEPPWAIREQQAEAMLAQLNPKTCVDRIVASLERGQEVQRIEVWEAGALCIYFCATHPAAQSNLQIRAVTDLSAMRDRWKAMATELRRNAPAEARFEEFHLKP